MRVKRCPDELFERLPTPKELWDLMNNIYSDEQSKALTALLYITGCRVSELLETKKENFIISENGKIKAELPVKKKRHEKKPTRIIPIPNDDFWKIAESWLKKRQNKERIFTFKTRNRAYQIISKMKWEGIPIYPHLLRHMKNNELIKARLTDKQRMKFFKWSRPQPAYEFAERADMENKIIENAFVAEKQNEQKEQQQSHLTRIANNE